MVDRVVCVCGTWASVILTRRIPTSGYEGEACDVAPLTDWHADSFGDLMREDDVFEDNKLDTDVDVPAVVDGCRARNLRSETLVSHISHVARRKMAKSCLGARQLPCAL
jgi:hypothetical protein